MSETTEVAIVKVSDVLDHGRQTVTIAGTRVVVFPFQDAFVAYVDVCAHQGGPVCSEGSLHPYLTAEIEPDGRVTDVFASGGDVVLACPWHGWEYWLETGRCIADSSKSLRVASVQVEGDELRITL